MKILVVGNGGREHALVWKIRQSPLVKDVYCAPGNAGIAGLADCVPIDTSNIIEVADFAQTISADLTVVGPELPMVLGIGDEFQRRGLPIFCPSRAAAEIEGSKAFAREFMNRHEIPSPRYAICSSREEAEQACQGGAVRLPARAEGGRPGRGQGRGRGRGQGRGQGRRGRDDGGQEVRHRGRQAGHGGVPARARRSRSSSSPTARAWCRMVSVQDHKRVGDGDTGPNTGGMGTVSPSTSLSLDVHKQIMQEIILPTIGGLSRGGPALPGRAVRRAR